MKLRKMMVGFMVINSFFCFAFNDTLNILPSKLNVGDDISALCIDTKTNSYILSSSGQIAPCITLSEGLDHYIIAFLNNKIVAIFYPLVVIKNKNIVAGKTTIREFKKLHPNCQLYEEIGFGYYYKLNGFDFIISIGNTGTDRLPIDDDIITSICKR